MALHNGRLRRLKAMRRRKRTAAERRRTSVHVNPLVLNRSLGSLSRRLLRPNVLRTILWTSRTSEQITAMNEENDRLLDDLLESAPPEPSRSPRALGRPSTLGLALINMLENSLTLPGTQTHAGLYLPYTPMQLPTREPAAGSVPNLTPTNEDIRERLRLVLKAARLDNKRYELTLASLNRRILAVEADCRHVKWLTDRSQHDIEDGYERLADLRQHYEELVQRVIDRPLPDDADEDENAVPEEYQGPAPVVPDEDLLEVPEPEVLVLDDDDGYRLD